MQNLNNGNLVNNSYEGGCHGEFWRNNGEQETFAVYAKEAGYNTSYSGKYLSAKNGDKALRGTPGCPQCLRAMPGYDMWSAQRHNAIYYNYSLIESNNGINATETRHGDSYYEDYFPDVVTNRTLAMIEEFTSQEGTRRPFLAVNAWPTAHGPFTPAPWAEHYHDGAKAPRTPNYNASYEHNQQKHWIIRQQSPMDDLRANLTDKIFEKRLESLYSVDSHIEQIVNLLEEKGELENTYIIYTSDNGFQLGQDRLWADKRHMYENDIRVPFIITGPGIPKNVTTDRPVLNVDIAPSIYELVTGQTQAPENMDGGSIIPYLLSLQGEIEGKGPAEDPYHREDFLVSYYGEGTEPCGLYVKQCPSAPPAEFRINDSLNNTYHCVRSLTASGYQHGSYNFCKDGVCAAPTATRDSIYCRFEDSEHFVEYYDHSQDPWQLNNRADELTQEERDYFELRLTQLRSCKGASCRAG
jgi:arylsulfatase A-like enzyme